VGTALAAADPFAIALWTLIACALIALVYATLALGRFLRSVDEIRAQVNTLSGELASTARVIREAMLAQSGGTTLAPRPVASTPPPPEPAAPRLPAAPVPPVPAAAPAPEAPAVAAAVPPVPMVEVAPSDPHAAAPRTIPLGAVPPAVPRSMSGVRLPSEQPAPNQPLLPEVAPQLPRPVAPAPQEEPSGSGEWQP
jgi:hypothetical protein